MPLYLITEYNGGFMKPQAYVGVGASAGGLEALERFFKAVPRDTQLAYIVVQHLSPDYKSLMVELLQRYTPLNILRIEDNMEVEAGKVYLIPPGKSLTMYNGKLFLEDQKPHHTLFLPIDIFFRSMAEDQGKNVVAVVLSGTGSDGTLGIRAVKETGGMIMVQNESSSQFDGMPKSAISTGIVDYILPPEEMPEQLEKYIKHPHILKSKNIEEVLLRNKDELSKILSILREKTGADFSYYKPNTIVRRIERRMSVNQIDKISNYVSWLLQSPIEANILYRELLIGVTRFFRDKEAYNYLQDEIIPKIFSNKKKGESIRIWSAGCSTGEEAYSIAMSLRSYEIQKLDGNSYDIKIFASDIDKEAIEFASAALYPESIVTDVPDDFLNKFFTRIDGGFQITENIRRMVIFAPHNVIKDPPFSNIDLVICRNALIYFKPVAQKKVLSMFHYSLQPGGYLFLGSSESLGELEGGFETISQKWKFYKYKKTSFINHTAEISSLQLEGKKDNSIPHLTDAFFSKRYKYEDITEKIISFYLPPSIVVDETYNLVHVYNDVGQYIKIPSGKVTLNILKMVDNNLGLVLGSILHKAFKTMESIKYTDIRTDSKDSFFTLSIKAKPFNSEGRSQKYAVISFMEEKELKGDCTEASSININSQYEERFKELEQELQFTKENLQSTIEELETSNEELQSTNEELIASNEELQSTNEELQSVNEELYTVNAEYQKKIEELTELNDDVTNIFNSTKIGTLFLDNNLRIRKFTPVIKEIIHLLETDIGRPIFHVSHNTDYPELIEEFEKVLKTLKPKNVETKNVEGNWYLIKILPYRTRNNAVEGVIVTAIDISTVKGYEMDLIRERELLKRVLENSPVGKTVVDKSGKITFVNKRAAEILGFSDVELKKTRFNDIKFKITDYSGNSIPDDELPFSIIMKTREPIYKYKHCIVHPDGKKWNLLINGSPIFDENGDVEGAVFSLDVE